MTTIEKLPGQILEQIQQVLPYDRGLLLVEDVNNTPRIHAQHGLSANANLSEFHLKINGSDFYKTVARNGEARQIRSTMTTA